MYLTECLWSSQFGPLDWLLIRITSYCCLMKSAESIERVFIGRQASSHRYMCNREPSAILTPCILTKYISFRKIRNVCMSCNYRCRHLSQRVAALICCEIVSRGLLTFEPLTLTLHLLSPCRLVMLRCSNADCHLFGSRRLLNLRSP